MGITFSFGQLIIDDYIVKNMQKIMARTNLLSSSLLDLPDDLHDFISGYLGNKRHFVEQRPQMATVFPSKEGLEDLNTRANRLADEIISSHTAEQVDPLIKKEMRRIVASAE